MEAKLKALKVADLRAILTKAGQPAPAKANKADLIAKIIASQPAIDAYNAIYHAPEANAAATTTAPEATSNDASQIVEEVEVPTTAIVTSPQKNGSETPASQMNAEETEEEKRKRRAARFGIPLVEPKPAKTKTKSVATPPPEDSDKLKSRAQRFGVTVQESASQKRAAEAELDPEEAEKRRKRAERFGMSAGSKA